MNSSYLGSSDLTAESHAEAEKLVNAVAESIYRDAERYRWFRQKGEEQAWISRLSEDELDAAIDAELAKATA